MDKCRCCPLRAIPAEKREWERPCFPPTLTGGKEKNVCVPCLIHAVRGKARVGLGGKGGGKGGVGLMGRDAKGGREERREMASLAASLLEKETRQNYYTTNLNSPSAL